MPEFPKRLSDTAALLEAYLKQVLAAEARRGTPNRLLSAMDHALLGGGKRLRPLLVIETARLFGFASAESLHAAAALECIHCYSLVHDDLPSMDNDKMRRGQPTVWKAYDEWTAILAGDALQALAFELLARPTCHPDPAVRSELVAVIAQAAGPSGMAGGQALDLEAERLFKGATPDIAHIALLQTMKTGRLICAACEAGAILTKASAKDRAALVRYGENLGFAFQISDDLLDAEGKAATVGKATRKDTAAGKATLVSLVGVKRAREHMDRVVEEAIAALAPFGEKAEVLADVARFMGRREN